MLYSEGMVENKGMGIPKMSEQIWIKKGVVW